MKWKAVTRRTRVLGVLTILSAIGSVWSFDTARQNPCVNHAALAPAATSGHFMPATFESSSRAHIVLVQDEDEDPDTTVDKPRGADVGAMNPAWNTGNDPHSAASAPCTPGTGMIGRLRGIFLVSFLIFAASTAYSLFRDRHRYAKRIRGRIRREEHRRRRDVNAPLLAPSIVGVAPQAPVGICVCGCNEATKHGQMFVPGHAQLLRLELERQAGGLLALRDLVEQHAKQELN